MTTPSALQETPYAPEILSGAFAVIRSAPIILGLFLFSGILSHVLPFVFGGVMRVALMSIGVVIAYRGLGGERRADVALWRRLFMTVIATFISYLLFISAVFTLAFMENYNYVVALVLALSGLYVYARLILAAPAVVIDGYGPFEALSKSWELTENVKRSITAAVVLVYVVGFVVLLSVYILFRVERVVLNVGGVFIIDPVLVGIQVSLYQNLTEMSEPVVRSNMETDAREITG
jgi:hypothetical protein